MPAKLFANGINRIRENQNVRLMDIAIIGANRVEEVPAGNVWEPNSRRPQLFLVEQYILRSFKGDLARDQLISSFSLMPHAKVTYNIFSKQSSATSKNLSTTVMESKNELATSTFNSQLKSSADSRFGKNDYNYQMDANFHGEAEWGVTDGSVDADVHAKGNTQEVRNELATSTQSAIDAQVAATDELRTQRTSSDDTLMNTEEVNESRMVKEIVNDTDQPVNIGVFQLKEETISLLCLTDVLIGFKNTVKDEDRLVSIRNIDKLLEDVIESPDVRKVIKQRVRAVLEDIRDFEDESKSLITVNPANPSSFDVNSKLKSKYLLKSPDGSVRRSIEVDGIIIKDYRNFIRKPNTSVELPIKPV